MSILDKARMLESRISRALTQAATEAVGSNEREPLEVAHAIVDAIEREVQSGGRGARLFPFNSLAISVLAPASDARARLAACFAAAPSLRERVVDRLRSAGCDVADLRFEVTTSPGPDGTGATRSFTSHSIASRRPSRRTRRSTASRRASTSPSCTARPNGATTRSPCHGSISGAARKFATAVTACCAPTTSRSSRVPRA